MELKQDEVNTLLESMTTQAMTVLKRNEVRYERCSVTVPKLLYEQEDIQYWKDYYASHNSEIDVLFIDEHDTYQLHEDGKIYKLFNKGYENLFHIDEKEIQKWQLK